MTQDTYEDISEDRVARLTRRLRKAGAISVLTTLQDNGLYTIIATFP